MSKGKKRSKKNSSDESDLSQSQATMDEFLTGNAAINVEAKLNNIKQSVITHFSLQIDELKAILFEVKRENEELKKEVLAHNEKIADLQQQNSLLFNSLKEVRWKAVQNEQYSRRSSLRIFGMKEEQKEDVNECEHKCLQLFKNKLNQSVTAGDVEAVHRVGRVSRDRPRPIIIKFCNRKVRDTIISQRRRLKGTPFVIAEDLATEIYQLQQKAKDHALVENAWTTRGKVVALLKDGRKVTVDGRSALDSQLTEKLTAKPADASRPKRPSVEEDSRGEMMASTPRRRSSP